MPVKGICCTDSSFENHRPVGQLGKMMNFFVHPVKTHSDQVLNRAPYRTFISAGPSGNDEESLKNK
jgi:hypothetical protein